MVTKIHKNIHYLLRYLDSDAYLGTFLGKYCSIDGMIKVSLLHENEF